MAIANAASVARYIQQCIADGRSDIDGYFVFTRKELVQNTGIHASTFNRNVDKILEYISKGFDFAQSFNIPGYKIGQENVFVDVSYSNGKLSFRRNPLTYTEEFEYMWSELKPKHPWFTYIYSTTYTDRNK